ncbi:MAG: hypothetical protein GY757_41665, partial [bacterium]|nr:hypothetical protein [bacterium]
WSAQDDAGNSDGIGSRYFTIQNTGGRVQSLSLAAQSTHGKSGRLNSIMVPVERSLPVGVIKGYGENVNPVNTYPGKNGLISIQIKELERLEVHLLSLSPGDTGFMVVGKQLKPLPTGSTLDTSKGIFYWQPGPGFMGAYRLVFLTRNHNGEPVKRVIEITVRPAN